MYVNKVKIRIEYLDIEKYSYKFRLMSEGDSTSRYTLGLKVKK